MIGGDAHACRGLPDLLTLSLRASTMLMPPLTADPTEILCNAEANHWIAKNALFCTDEISITMMLCAELRLSNLDCMTLKRFACKTGP